MTDKQKQELRKLGVEIVKGELPHAIHGTLYDQDNLESFIEKLIEEVEESLSQNSDFLLKATRDLEQKSCNHMTNLEYYDGTIQCTRCYKFLTGKEYIKVLNNCGIGN